MLRRMLKKAAFSPAQPWRVLHPPSMNLPRQPLHPGTRLVPSKAAAPQLTLVSRFTFHASRFTAAGSEARTKLADFFSILLLNARLALEPAHILHDLIDIPGGHAFDLRHIAEFPMVRLDAVGRSPLEGRIPVMVRLVDLMH